MGIPDKKHSENHSLKISEVATAILPCISPWASTDTVWNTFPYSGFSLSRPRKAAVIQKKVWADMLLSYDGLWTVVDRIGNDCSHFLLLSGLNPLIATVNVFVNPNPL